LKIKELGEINDEKKSDLCASYQEAIVDVLIEKLHRAQKVTGLKRAVITGGVSANSRLRMKAGDSVLCPPLRYCTDNAAMIGYVGIEKLQRGHDDSKRLSASATIKAHLSYA
jgi:N6-L-threonylcarbamoyladenine synthase